MLELQQVDMIQILTERRFSVVKGRVVSRGGKEWSRNENCTHFKSLELAELTGWTEPDPRAKPEAEDSEDGGVVELVEEVVDDASIKLGPWWKG